MELFWVTICWFLAGVFSIALRHKVRQGPRFTATLAAYRLLPHMTLGAVVWTLKGLEAAAIAGLLFVQTWAGMLAAFLLGIYLLAIAVNLLRGRVTIDCGCGDTPTPLSGWLVVRNLVLLLAASIAAWGLSGAGPILWSVPLLLSGFGCAVLALVLYMAIEQLLANRGLHDRLWRGVAA